MPNLDKYQAIFQNINAIRVVTETLKTTLGPYGFDKMLRDKVGDVAITNSSAVILYLANIRHPAAKLLVSLGVVHNREYGDGVATLSTLIGELLRNAQELILKGFHPSLIIEGYNLALKKAREYLRELSLELRKEDLYWIALSYLGSPSNENKYIARIVAEAIEKAGTKDNIYVNYRPGGSIYDTKLIDGVFIDLGKRVHPDMPRVLKRARILCINREFTVRAPPGMKVSSKDPRSLLAFTEFKHRVTQYVVGLIKKIGANVVLCDKNIDEIAMYYLARAGILGVRDVEPDVLELIAKATGATIISNARDLSPEVLGYAELIVEDKIGMEEIMYITGCKNGNVCSILVRGGSEINAMEMKRKIESLVTLMDKVYKSKKIVAGGGAIEMELANRLRKFAKKIPSKLQLVVEAYANALESIPRYLAYNSGMNELDTILELRRRHANGERNIGIDCNNKEIVDTYKKGIVDFYDLKEIILIRATEFVNSILKIDDVIFVKRKKKREELPKEIREEVKRAEKVRDILKFKSQ